MDLRRFLAVFGKELSEHGRDRRSLFSASIGVILGPLMLAFILNQAAEERRSLDEIRLRVVGVERAPNLAAWLETQAGVEVVDFDGDPVEAVREGDFEVALEVDEDYVEDFTAGRPAEVRLLYNDRRSRSRAMAGRIRRMMQAYASNVGALRLIARGVAPDLVQAVKVENFEVSAEDSRGRRVLGIVPMMLLLAVFAAGMSASADSTAGERERGSLEALLANPVTPAELIAGKWAAAATLAATGLAASLAFHLLVLTRAPLYEVGVRLRVSPELVLVLLAVALPVAFFAPALEMLIAMFARSFKEAQSYLAFAIMIPTLPILLTSMSEAQAKPWLELIPIVGQSQTILNILLRQPSNVGYVLGCAVLTLGLAAVCLVAITRLLRREAIVFGRG